MPLHSKSKRRRSSSLKRSRYRGDDVVVHDLIKQLELIISTFEGVETTPLEDKLILEPLFNLLDSQLSLKVSPGKMLTHFQDAITKLKTSYEKIKQKG